MDTYGHPRVVPPRRRGYSHRPIIVVSDDVGLTDSGQYVENLLQFARKNPSHLWITYKPSDLVFQLLEVYESDPTFRLGGGGIAPPKDGRPWVQKIKLTTFGWDTPGKRKQARHILTSPGAYFGGDIPARGVVPDTLPDLLSWAIGLRGWCKEHDIPLGRSLSNLSASIARDRRFWPDARGRVPRATNERVRPYLPGAKVTSTDHTGYYPHVFAIDQRRSYHTIASEIALPDPTTLYARGFFTNPDCGKVWTRPGQRLYKRTTQQPGLYALLVSIPVSARAQDKELTLPCLVESVRGANGNPCRVIYVWSPELREVERDTRVTIIGLVAAWTSTIPEAGLRDFALWARSQIDARPDLARWLKPTLHGVYGLLAARPVDLIRAELHMRNGEDYPIYYNGRRLVLQARRMHHVSPITNVAVLGVLQAELRVRTLEMARYLRSHGGRILRIHADGIHCQIGQLPLYDEARWSCEELTHVRYLDDVTFVSAEKIVAPGRSGGPRDRIQRIRDRARHLRTSVQASAHDAKSAIITDDANLPSEV